MDSPPPISSHAAEPQARARARVVIALILALIGFAASVAAIYASPINGVTDLGCGRVFDCSEVLGSRWGSVAGIPLGVLGGFYFAFWGFSLVAWTPSKAPLLRFTLTWTLTVGSVVSLALLALLIFAIEGNCVYCLITHVANLAAAALLWPIRSYRLPFEEIRRDLFRLIATGVLALLVGLSLFLLYENRVERATEKAKEQTIW